MYDWNKPDERELAFKQAIGLAMTDKDVKKALLDPKTAKKMLQEKGEIRLPKKMQVVFYRQEDTGMRLVMVIPGVPTPPHEATISPGFKSCMRCTWITYRKRLGGAEEMRLLGKQPETKSR